MTRAEIDAEPEGYRGPPKDIEYHGQEHHPICAWCKFMYVGSWTGNVWCKAYSLRHFDDMASFRNSKGQCDNYAPSLSTRVRQLVKLRPFVARIREGIVSQAPSGRIEYVHESWHTVVRRSD
jgi:hypothetical protein